MPLQLDSINSCWVQDAVIAIVLNHLAIALLQAANTFVDLVTFFVQPFLLSPLVELSQFGFEVRLRFCLMPR